MLFVGFIFLLGMTLGIAQEYTGREAMHSARFYSVVMIIVPVWIAAAVRASKNRWAATIVASLYIAMHLGFTWLLPLVPAEPKLGPVYQKITHLVPTDFPLLIIVPAIVFDLVRQRTSTWSKWTQAVVLGAAFLASFLVVQWPFANFLMSPASHNWIFATGPGNMPYFVPPDSPWVSSVFVRPEGSVAAFCTHMLIPLVVAVVMTRIGLGWGDWMRRIRR
jgi:hypothetical protein